jgi:enoyl-CoA hydratase/carnithine racemase
VETSGAPRLVRIEEDGHARGVRVEVDARVAHIVLDRPELLNRIDNDVHEELESVFKQVAAMTDIRAVVFAATGNVFTAGGDFDFILSQNATADRHATIKKAVGFFDAFLSIPCPVVVALHGDVAGIGASLVLSAEAVVSHPAARISDPHVVVGLAAGDGGCIVWPMSAGMMLAKRHLITGEPMRAVDAHRVGLISDLVDMPADVLPAARKLAENIAALPPIAVQGTKLALNHLVRQRFAEVGEIAAAMEYESLKSRDVTEAVAAIRERRAPRYDGT